MGRRDPRLTLDNTVIYLANRCHFVNRFVMLNLKWMSEDQPYGSILRLVRRTSEAARQPCMIQYRNLPSVQMKVRSHLLNIFKQSFMFNDRQLRHRDDGEVSKKKPLQF